VSASWADRRVLRRLAGAGGLVAVARVSDGGEEGAAEHSRVPRPRCGPPRQWTWPRTGHEMAELVSKIGGPRRTYSACTSLTPVTADSRDHRASRWTRSRCGRQRLRIGRPSAGPYSEAEGGEDANELLATPGRWADTLESTPVHTVSVMVPGSAAATHSWTCR